MVKINGKDEKRLQSIIVRIYEKDKKGEYKKDEKGDKIFNYYLPIEIELLF
jgi:hypothetical protein